MLLRFGASMLGAGNTAARTREWIDVLARKLGFDAVSVGLSLDGITIECSVRRPVDHGNAGAKAAGDQCLAHRRIGAACKNGGAPNCTS